MEEKGIVIQDALTDAKQKSDILCSTLLAIYVAHKENVLDATVYTEAIYGSMDMARQLKKSLEKIISSIGGQTGT